MIGRAACVSLMFCVLAGACAQGARVEPQSVTPDYVIGGGEWDSGGGITVAARAFEQNGATVVCGAWATDRQSAVSAGLNENVMEAASVYAGGVRMVQNLGFMARTSYAENITGARANCIAVAHPWRAAFVASTRVEIPRQRFVLDDQSNNSVTFRQSPRPDIVK